MYISKFKSKQLLILTVMISLILLGVHIYAFSVLYPQLKDKLREVILNTWLLGIFLTMVIYSSAHIQQYVCNLNKFLYKLLYHVFYKNKASCLILDSHLRVMFINKAANKNFSTHQQKIHKHIPSFSMAKLQSGRLKFDALGPNKRIKKILFKMSHATYTNRFNYGALSLTCKIRKLELMGYNLGFQVVIMFDKVNVTAEYKDSETTQLENLRIKMINLMLKDAEARDSSEYLNLYNNINSLINTKRVASLEIS